MRAAEYFNPFCTVQHVDVELITDINCRRKSLKIKVKHLQANPTRVRVEGYVEGLLAERGPRGAGQPGRPKHLRLGQEQYPRGHALQGRAHRPLPILGRSGVSANLKDFSAIHPLCRKVLKMTIWGIPDAGGPLL